MSNDVRIAAGIVLYNPDDIKRVTACIDSVKKQVERIYIFDNSTKKIEINMDDSIIYISNSKNYGVAYALNSIMSQAKKDGFLWVLTMDQDSILPQRMINEFKEYIVNNSTSDIGIICPQVIDKRRTYMEVKAYPKEEYIEMCITSASCTSIEAWEKIGKFDEWLFIDLVDNEFCKRLTISGYKILKLNNWVLDQEFGKIIPKTKRKQKIWIKVSKFLNNANFAKFSYKKIVNPLRVYYSCRNIIYVNKKMKKYGTVGYENYNCKGYFGFIIYFILPSILRSQNKKEVMKAVKKGIRDGKRKSVVIWSATIE